MPVYQNGKIYKTWDNEYQECYVGSSIQDLSIRMAEHRKKYRAYKNGAKQTAETNSYKLFNKYGLNNCRVQLEELPPCDSKMELQKREGYHIRNSKCVNKQVAGRTHKEYHQENRVYLKERVSKYCEQHKEEIQEYKNQYFQNSKDKLTRQHKEYQDKNKEKVREQKRQYRENNADIIKGKRKETYTCDCGTTLRKGKKPTWQIKEAPTILELVKPARTTRRALKRIYILLFYQSLKNIE